MAGFGFTEAQEMFRREVRDFARRELAPGAKERAKVCGVSHDILKKVADMGLLGISLPEKYGGQGADWVSLGIAIEEVTKADFLAGMLPVYSGVSYLCLEQGQEEVRQEWLPAIIRGEKSACFAVTEPDAGSDAAGMQMTATREGDYYVLNGEKTSISFGMDADAAILFAKTNPKERSKGVTCFWVPLDLPGINRVAISHSGFKPIHASSIAIDGARLPAKYRVGEEGKGFYVFAGGGTDFLRPCLGMVGLGLAQVSLEETMNYVVQRTAFGQPIARFEGVSFKIAEHATLIEAARLLCYRTFFLKDQGLPHTKESAMCKWWCPVVAFDAIHDCLLLHGHLGYSEDYPLEQRLRDALGLEFADGTAQIMKIIIARELMGRVAVPY